MGKFSRSQESVEMRDGHCQRQLCMSASCVCTSVSGTLVSQGCILSEKTCMTEYCHPMGRFDYIIIE